MSAVSKDATRYITMKQGKRVGRTMGQATTFFLKLRVEIWVEMDGWVD